MITEQRVREGLANEALCLSDDLHPRSELAAQKTSYKREDGTTCETWSIFYISSRTAYTLTGGLSKDHAEMTLRRIAHRILTAKNPAHAARHWNRGY